MAKVILEYNARSIQAQKTLEYILSVGFFRNITTTQTVKKSRLEQSLEDVDKGNIFFLAGPAKL